MSSLSDVTSATTVESQSGASFTELATLMESVSNELGQMSVTGAKKQEKQVKKKQKKGRIVSSRYMASVKAKPIGDAANVKPRKSTTASTVRRSVRTHSPNIRQQLVLDATLPTPAGFNASAMISSTPAVTEQEGITLQDIGAVIDGSYITVPNISADTKASDRTSKKASHHTNTVEEDKQKKEEFQSLRCCALQWAYLDAMTMKAFEQQEEQAKSQIHQLHSSLLKTMDENKTLQNEIASIEHQMAVDATLHSQLQGLGAVVAHLPEMEPQYRKMAQLLDNTRHLMKTNEVIVPSEDELLVTLQRSVELTDKLLSLIDSPQLTELAETSKALEDMKATIDKTLESNEKLTKDLADLQIEEASLTYNVNLLDEIYNVEKDS